MIEWDKSAELNKMGIDELKTWFEKYPSSGKRIIVICEECNKEREIYFNAYRELCKHCAMKQESIIEKLSNAANRQWSVSGAREAHSDYMRQAFIDGDKRFKKQGLSLRQFYKENPDKLEDMRLRNKEIFANESIKKEISLRNKKWRIENPDKVRELNEKVALSHKDPNFREKQRINRLNQVMPTRETKIERMIQKILIHHDYKFETHNSVCKICIPDIVFPEKKIAIFCDGDYWHNYPDGNDRDRNQDKVLLENDWISIRFWEHEIHENIVECFRKFEAIYNNIEYKSMFRQKTLNKWIGEY